MKKKLLFGFIPLLALGFASCTQDGPVKESSEISSSDISSIISGESDGDTWSSFETPDIPWNGSSVDTGSSSQVESGSAQTTPSTTTEESSSTGGSSGSSSSVPSTATATKKTFNNNLKKDGPLTQEAFPSLGSPKLLVIPVNLVEANKTDATKAEIDKAFNGTSAETGWESVASYYKKSSYGKLTMSATVTDWFTPSKATSEYESYSDSDYNDGTNLILNEALAFFEDKYDYNDYDYDKDGYIDSVWLIYNHDVDYTSDDSIYWAFTSLDYAEVKYDNLYANYYAWAGIGFMHQTYEQAGYETSDITIDAHTYIHETGHLMGLDDYYDYDDQTGATGGTYWADMMDATIGDHSIISKMLLGWVSPTVLEGKGDITLDLESFTDTGNFLLVSIHTLTSIYDEYFLLEFYTNTGLNTHDEPIIDSDKNKALGIRVYHVDANFNYENGSLTYNSGNYQSGFKYDNSDEKYKFVDVMRADYSSSMKEWLTGDSLYTPTSKVFGVTSATSEKYHDNSSLNFSFVVNTVTSTKANLTITLK